MDIVTHKLSQYHYMRTVAIFFTILIVWQLPVTSHAGECLESNEEMYQGMVESYEHAKDGMPSAHFGWISQGCWGVDRRRGGEGNGKDLTPQLLDLLRKMISDPRLHETTKASVIEIYGSFSGADDFLLEQFKHATGKSRAAIMSRLKTAEDTPKFSRLAFLKEYAAKETDPGLKRSLLHQLAQKVPFPEFRAYCSENGIELTEEFILQDYPGDMDALDHLYQVSLSKKVKPDLHDAAGMAAYFNHSSYVYGVLARNLDAEFSVRYLELIRSGELRYLKNGILAYYGKHFRSKVLESYFYGSYSYVQWFCRKSGCGRREKPAKDFHDGLLTKTDLANINAIAAIENKRQQAGYKEPHYFIENYDLNAFLKGAVDNVTLSQAELGEVYEIRLDVAKKKIWLWERKGVSGWSLETGKRIKFYKGATGPLAFNAKTRLLAYQVKNEIVLENTDSGKAVYRTALGRFDRYRPERILNAFSPDGSLFVYVDYNPKTWSSDLKVVNTIDGSLLLTKPMEGGNFRFFDLSERGGRLGNPLVFLQNNNYLVARVNVGSEMHCEKSALMVLPLDEPEKMRRLPTELCAIALYAKEDRLYIDGGDQKPILVFNSRDILAAGETLPSPVLSISVGDADIRYMKRLLVSDTFILRADYSYLGYLPLSGPEQGRTKLLAYSHRFDADLDADLIALADHRGFVIVRRISDLIGSAR